MKYSVKYHRDFRYLKEVDEITIKYKDKPNELIDFLKTIEENQRVVLDMTDEKILIINILGTLETLVKVHKNIVLKIPFYQREVCADLYEMNIPYFFAEFVGSWDVLMSYINLRVSDVYIVNELGFQLKDISKICKDNNVNIRVFPNVAQFSSTVDNLEKIKAFFIRPEDVEIYEPYVDIFEFFGPADRQSVLYKIYKEEKQWLGDLKELIIGLETSLYSRTILPLFAEERLNCGKKCYYGKCLVCEKIATIAKQFESLNMEVKK